MHPESGPMPADVLPTEPAANLAAPGMAAVASAPATPVPGEAAAEAVSQAQAGGIVAPLRVRDFRFLFAGESISVVGDYFHFVALAWLALQLTGSGLALGTVLMTAGIPRAVFILLGGALSDRVSPRTLMLASNAIRGVVVAVVAALVLTEQAELWHLYVLAGIFGVVDAVFYPALNTILPMLVAPRLLPGANALMQGMQQFAGLVGPALAGLLVAAVRTGPAFVVDAISFGIAAAALLMIRGGRRTAPASTEDGGDATGGSLLSTIGEGLRYAWADPAIRGLVVLTAAFNFAFTGPVMVGLAALADDRFAGGSAAFGILLSGWGAGALVGALVAGSLSRIPHLGAVVLALAAVMGVGLGLLGIAPSVPIAFAVLLAVGISGGFVNVRVIAWLQARVPEQFIGRVMSLVMLGSVGLGPISLAIAGAMVDLGSTTLLFSLAMAIVLVTVVAGWIWGLPSRMGSEA